MARFNVLMLCLVGLVAFAAAINDDKCPQEMEKVMIRYSGQACEKILNDTITATQKNDCPNTHLVFDCFAMNQEAWTDLLDDCENLFDKSACLKSYGDDEFERMVKDNCAAKRRNLMGKYSAGDQCNEDIKQAVYANNDAQCPNMTRLAECFYAHEDDWTDAVDECEGMFKYSGCSALRNLGDDEFERWVNDVGANAAAPAAGLVAVVLAAVGACMLLAL